jgi:hypothetical protein
VTIQITTDLGEKAARRLAEFEADMEVYISLIFQADDCLTYIFTTNGHRDDNVVSLTVKGKENE